MSRLLKEEVMGLRSLKQKHGTKLPNTTIARLFEVTEGTIRYHLRKDPQQPDRRAGKPMKADPYSHIIAHWIAVYNKRDRQRAANVQALFEYLQDTYAYPHSYKSVLRFVRAHYPPPPLRPHRRVELPAGCLAQVDWLEKVRIRLGGTTVILHAFVMTLTFSRAFAVVWTRDKSEASWIACHNKAFRFLGGIPAAVRPDNVKTAISQGQGSRGRIHPTYLAYARDVGFVVSASRAGMPTDKGKVEAKVRLVRRLLESQDLNSATVDELQGLTESLITKKMQRLRCPATGNTVLESLEQERVALRPLPSVLPHLFDVAVTRRVRRDATISFEGHTYSVPFSCTGALVEVRGYPGVVRIFHEGQCVRSFARGTRQLVVIDQGDYEGPPTERIAVPTPLGSTVRLLLEAETIPVARRAITVYEKLCEGTS